MTFINKLKDRLLEIKTATIDIAESNYVPKEIEEKRIEICNSCEHLFKPTGNCKRCGCFMQVKAKLEHSKCPIGKW